MANTGAVPAAPSLRDLHYPLLQKGVNLEGEFMFNSHPQNDPATFVPWYPDAILQSLKRSGFTHVRLNTEMARNLLDETTPAVPVANAYANLKSVVSRILAAGLAVVLDFHHYDGFYDTTDFTRSKLATNTNTIRDKWIQCATTICQYFAGVDGHRIFFQTFNEPSVVGNWTDAQWYDYNVAFITAVRAVAPTNTFVVAGRLEWPGNGALSGSAQPYDKLQDLITRGLLTLDSNLVFDFHYYIPSVLTHGGLTSQVIWAGVKGLIYPVSGSQPELDNIALLKSTLGYVSIPAANVDITKDRIQLPAGHNLGLLAGYSYQLQLTTDVQTPAATNSYGATSSALSVGALNTGYTYWGKIRTIAGVDYLYLFDTQANRTIATAPSSVNAAAIGDTSVTTPTLTVTPTTGRPFYFEGHDTLYTVAAGSTTTLLNFTPALTAAVAANEKIVLYTGMLNLTNQGSGNLLVGHPAMNGITQPFYRESYYHLDYDGLGHGFNLDTHRFLLKKMTDWAASNSVKIYMGEWGMSRYQNPFDVDSRGRYNSDVNKVACELGIANAVWDLNGSFSILNVRRTVYSNGSFETVTDYAPGMGAEMFMGI